MNPIIIRLVLPAVLLVVLWLIASAVKARSVKKDELGFTHVFVEAVKHRWPAARVDVQAPLQLEIRRAKAPDRLSLAEAYAQYRAEPRRLGELVQHHLRLLEQSDVAEAESPPTTAEPPTRAGDPSRG